MINDLEVGVDSVELAIATYTRKYDLVETGGNTTIIGDTGLFFSNYGIGVATILNNPSFNFGVDTGTTGAEFLLVRSAR